MWDALQHHFEAFGGFTLVKWLSIVSVPAFFGSIGLSLWMVAAMDVNHFRRHRKRHMFSDWPLPLYWLLLVIKNLFGFILFVAGLMMLVLPGQGLLTILLSLYLLDFPYKHRVEAVILARPNVRQSLNWLRQKLGKKPFIFEED